MISRTWGKILLFSILVMTFVLTGCSPTEVSSSGRGDVAQASGASANTAGAGPGGNTLGPGATSIPPKVEIRHLIEPNLSLDPTYSSGTEHAGGGSYVRKLTLPKNFQGRIYLAGINIGTLADRHVKVRFKFGVGRDPVTLGAFVSRAPGITPQNDIHVLVMDMRSAPFRQVRLPYDLFDYNDYSANSSTPTQDNRDSGLYCRGLQLRDDSTFTGVGACDGIPDGEECLYAYAKIMDQGLVKEESGLRIPTIPTMAQVKSTSGGTYFDDLDTHHLKKPLPDHFSSPFQFNQTISFNLTSSASQLINMSTYLYQGPYRLINQQDWHYRFSDLTEDRGLFRDQTSNFYYQSNLFPLATRLDLNAGVPHLASSNWSEARSLQTLSSGGKTLWMDGANARAQSRNSDLEHIGSCNVSATIEILASDKNNNEYIVAESRDVKLQLVRPVQHFTDTGNDVLFSNFKSCSSNSSCGSSECCFNNRCWDQSLVSQCFDNSLSQGNRQVGQSCLTDLECSSLCCNRTSGLCSPHNSFLSPAVLCSKPMGDFCIAKEWCQKVPVVKCLVVRTGTDVFGNVTCRQQCYTTEEYGDCKNGMCAPPFQEPIPVFDPNDPAACNNAVPAPNF
jgi:hypothetical protein